jgi:hypothetical protein
MGLKAEKDERKQVWYKQATNLGYPRIGKSHELKSYSSHCVRPPVIYGDVMRPDPMTVRWSRFAQERTDRTVKGMLTGPVTILQWSFVRNDQPRTERSAYWKRAIENMQRWCLFETCCDVFVGIEACFSLLKLLRSATTVSAGTDGLFFLPYLTRERLHHPLAESSGAFLGLRIDHRREHLLHAALEGVAFGIRVAFEAHPAASKATALRLAGGGSEHRAWCQMLADILNRELLTIDTPAASVRGAALLGGIASGIWADAWATASIAPRPSLVAAPSAEQGAVYNRVYTQYLESINR